jgi:maleate cis-trans isomerase
MSAAGRYRIGQMVPSSNVTMETEVPELFRRREQLHPERFTFHSSRMRMTEVTAEELAAMDAESDRCAVELSGASLDVVQEVEDELGKPVLSTAICTAHRVMRVIGLPAEASGAGTPFGGDHALADGSSPAGLS